MGAVESMGRKLVFTGSGNLCRMITVTEYQSDRELIVAIEVDGNVIASASAYMGACNLHSSSVLGRVLTVGTARFALNESEYDAIRTTFAIAQRK